MKVLFCRNFVFWSIHGGHLNGSQSQRHLREQFLKLAPRKARQNLSSTASASTCCGEYNFSNSGRQRDDIPSMPSTAKSVQTCDFTSLSACTVELQALWVPSKVDQVIQSDANTLCLNLRNQDCLEGGHVSRRWLFLSWHQTHARICIGMAPERGSSAEAFSLAEQMHSALRGLVLLDVLLPKTLERIVELRLGPRLQEVSHRLFLEVMGNLSNLILVDKNNRIMSCARQVSNKMSSKRILRTGSLYMFPPTQSGCQPSSSEPLESWQATLCRSSQTSLAAAMAKAYQGMSPMTAAHLCKLCCIDSNSLPDMLTDSQWQILYKCYSSWVEALEQPDKLLKECKHLLALAAGVEWQDNSFLRIMDTYYRSPQEEDGFSKHLRTVRNAVEKALKRAAAKETNLNKQLDQVKLAGEIQKQADLIMANLHRYSRGDDQLAAEDWDSGATITLPLDPSKGAKEQAEALYKKARKLRRTSENVQPLLDGIAEDRDYLLEIQSQLENLQPGDSGDLVALQQIQDELVEKKFCKPPPDAALKLKGARNARKANRQSGAAARPNFRQYTSPGGLQVLVGRNNVQNDELTHSVAAPNDLWFHARGVPGSHTILRTPSSWIETEKDIQFAANTAAFFSKARLEGKADVVMALTKHLAKPKGGRPGQVIVQRERVIIAFPSEPSASKK